MISAPHASSTGPSKPSWRRSTVVLAALTLLVLLISLPQSLKYARDNRGLYLFSRAFVEDIPKRLTGPGRFRFIIQPAVAIVLGIGSGIADARAGRSPYLWGILFHRRQRGALMRSALATIANLLLMGILIDSICQWLILGTSYAGAALIVGPVLIVTPYAATRALTNRAASYSGRS